MYLIQTSTTDLLINKLTFLIAFGISAFALVKAAQSFAQENSVGKKAIKDVKANVETISRDMEAVKNAVDECEGENSKLRQLVQKLDDDIRDILQNTIQWYQNQIRGR